MDAGQVPTFDHREDVDPFTVSDAGFSINLTIQKVHEVTKALPGFVHVDLLVSTGQTPDPTDPLL
ncbi:hypothetical protein WG907_06100 [Sphingobium sp. AN558]|uniref:hypothetical protein n=1 Tax=Sphingobium sp. AN558 TaxID=3133442 RepID=UPI0030BED72F